MEFKKGDRVVVPQGTCIVVTNQEGLTAGETQATVTYAEDDYVHLVVDRPEVLPECQQRWNAGEGLATGHTEVHQDDLILV